MTGQGRFVGRTAEVEVLDRALLELALGRGGAIEVAGEPGIGKTRLLSELGTRADEHGMLVLSGSASELERNLPFWIFVDAIDEYLRGLEPARLDALGEDARRQLAQVFPTLATTAAHAAASPRDERYRAHRAVGDLLEVLAAIKPLVLALDDLHWADSGSIDLIGALLRRPPGAAVLVAMALRPRQLPERLAPALERAYREGTLVRVDLEGLSADESRQLLGASVDATSAVELYRESGGNPFYLEQLARARRPAGPSAGDGVVLEGIDVPRPVAAALAEELSALPACTRRVLEGAAVVGDPFEPELAAAAADVPEATVVEALDELLGRDLVRVTDVPRRFRFRHPLVRRAVYEAAPGGWRLSAHERTAAVLARLGVPAAVRAHHVECSARHGDLAAVAVLREAAETVAPRAPSTAGGLFGAALRLLPAETAPTERSELLEVQAKAFFAAGQFDQAYDALRNSLALLGEDELSSRVRVTATCAEVENLLGRHREAHTRLVSALASLPDVTSREAIALMVALAVDGFYRMDYESMQEWAQRSADTSKPLDDRPLRAATAALTALTSALGGAVDVARTSRSDAAALAETLSDLELSGFVSDLVNLAAAEIHLDRHEQGGERAEQALALARATGQGHVLPILFWVGTIRRVRGRLDDAAEVFDAAVEVARLKGHAEGLAWNLFGRSLTADAAGDAGAALAAAAESVDALDGMERSFLSMGAGIAMATALASDGQPVRSAETLIEAGGGEELELIPPAWRPEGFELLTRCLVAQGRHGSAAFTAARARAAADALGLRMPTVPAGRAAAVAALALGDAQTAADTATACAATAEELGAPIEAAHAHHLAGRALAHNGDRPRAVTELERAAFLFEVCGALTRRDESERVLGTLGRRPHRRTRPGRADGDAVDALTERELQVARLVVNRKTNAQIADELFVSRKTVETHIRHLFEKLSVTSRVDVARVVERAERSVR